MEIIQEVRKLTEKLDKAEQDRKAAEFLFAEVAESYKIAEKTVSEAVTVEQHIRTEFIKLLSDYTGEKPEKKIARVKSHKGETFFSAKEATPSKAVQPVPVHSSIVRAAGNLKHGKASAEILQLKEGETVYGTVCAYANAHPEKTATEVAFDLKLLKNRVEVVLYQYYNLLTPEAAANKRTPKGKENMHAVLSEKPPGTKYADAQKENGAKTNPIPAETDLVLVGGPKDVSSNWLHRTNGKA